MPADDALFTEGEQYAMRWLVPLLPMRAALLREGRGELEWAIPPAHARGVMGDAGNLFHGMPVVIDAEVVAPTVRVIHA